MLLFTSAHYVECLVSPFVFIQLIQVVPLKLALGDYTGNMLETT